MNPTSTKFGYTDESTGITNDRNTVPVRPWYIPPTGGGCGCPSAEALKAGDCECNQIDVMPIRYLGPPIASPVSYPVTGCTGHQAPSGYKYVNQNGNCVLADMSGVPVASGAVPVATTTDTTTTAAAVLSGITDQIKALYASNPYLVYGAVGLGIYLLSKKK